MMESNQPGDVCQVCGSHEVNAMTPRTVYSCGSSDYDKRPGTFVQGRNCVPPTEAATHTHIAVIKCGWYYSTPHIKDMIASETPEPDVAYNPIPPYDPEMCSHRDSQHYEPHRANSGED